MMVKNSNNINKVNNYLSPQINEHTKNMMYLDGNPGPGLGQTQKCDQMHGIPTPS
jgi:hypothetical protein